MLKTTAAAVVLNIQPWTFEFCSGFRTSELEGSRLVVLARYTWEHRRLAGETPVLPGVSCQYHQAGAFQFRSPKSGTKFKCPWLNVQNYRGRSGFEHSFRSFGFVSDFGFMEVGWQRLNNSQPFVETRPNGAIL